MIALGSIDSVRAAVPPGLVVTPGAVRRGDPLVVRGWALDAISRDSFDSIDAVFADGTVADGVVGLPRPDVVQAFALEPSVQPGFTIVAATDDLTAGPQEVLVRGLRLDDEPQRIATFGIEVRAPARAIDATAGISSARVVIDPIRIDGAVKAPIAIIEGWALDETSWLPGTRVVVTAGKLAVEAVYGYPRPDVVTVFGLGDAALHCGFRARVACDELDAPEARAHLDTAGGARYSGEAVALPQCAGLSALMPAAEPRGSIESICVLDPDSNVRELARPVRVHPGDRVVITGWTECGSGDGEILAVVDGMRRVSAFHDTAREDVAASLAGRPPAGFSASIGIDALAPGVHEIDVYVRGDDGTFRRTAARAAIEIV